MLHYRALSTPPLFAYFQTAVATDTSIMQKEAIYTAMGCASSAISSAFNFNDFFTSTIVQDAQIQGPWRSCCGATSLPRGTKSLGIDLPAL